MFAAQAGAKHVYGVDCSSIAEQARQIVELNGFSDKITIIKGKVSVDFRYLRQSCQKVKSKIVLTLPWFPYRLKK